MTEYMYDVFGNTESVYEISNSSDIFYTRYTYDLNNRLETAYSLGEYTVYDYDRNGNMISRVGTGITDSFTYDIFGRLTSANVGNNRVEYEYDYRGLRAAKTVNNERTDYILSGDNVLGESRNGAYQYYYRGIGLIGYTDYIGNNYVYKKNAHGDISATVDMFGNTVHEYTYDAYGNEDIDYGMYRYGGKITPAITDTNPYRYAGEYYDLETGFIYLRARYYDPTLCRFISEDAYWNVDNMIYGDDENAKSPNHDAIIQSANLYAYAMNSPLEYIDPTGNFSSGEVLKSSWELFSQIGSFDGPSPYADIVGAGVAVGGSIIAGGLWLGEAIYNFFDDADEKTADVPNNNNNNGKENTSTKGKDERLTGEPGEIKTNDDKETKIGSDGRATRERHNTDHGAPKYHTNPHDHDITWDDLGKPHFGPAINYPDGAPVLK